jgi:alpha-ketoglutarate-dependent taurine dioxygenase
VSIEPINAGPAPAEASDTATGAGGTVEQAMMCRSLQETQQALSTHGWAVLMEAGFTDGSSIDYAAVERIACWFGAPSSRDGGKAIWPVAATTDRPEATFSIRSGEARLHTDAAYRADPENLFALFCVRPARDGGLSRLLAADRALDGLEPEVLTILRQPVWRWTPPDTFGGKQDVARAVIRKDGQIRWRLDNLDVATDLRAVADGVDAHFDGHPLVVHLPLATDSVLFCDNERALHGRTWFTDPQRLLLRVRLVTT